MTGEHPLAFQGNDVRRYLGERREFGGGSNFLRLEKMAGVGYNNYELQWCMLEAATRQSRPGDWRAVIGDDWFRHGRKRQLACRRSLSRLDQFEQPAVANDNANQAAA